MQFLKGLTRWFHFNRTPIQVERCPQCDLPLEPGGACPQCGEYPRTTGCVESIQDTSGKPQQLVSRRNLLFGLGAVAVVAAVPEVIELARVWSIPPAAGLRHIVSRHADPGRIDLINLNAWGREPWSGIPYFVDTDTEWKWIGIDRYPVLYGGARGGGKTASMALQLEAVRQKLPTLYDYDDQMFKLISRAELRENRKIIEFWRGDQYVSGDEISARTMRIPLVFGPKDSYDLDRTVGYTGFDGPLIVSEEVSLETLKRNYPEHSYWNGRKYLAGRPDNRMVNPKVEAGKVSRLLDRYGQAVADKVDREVVAPVRDQLEQVCDLVNG
jgi:hypothetical protein